MSSKRKKKGGAQYARERNMRVAMEKDAPKCLKLTDIFKKTAPCVEPPLVLPRARPSHPVTADDDAQPTTSAILGVEPPLVLPQSRPSHPVTADADAQPTTSASGSNLQDSIELSLSDDDHYSEPESMDMSSDDREAQLPPTCSRTTVGQLHNEENMQEKDGEDSDDQIREEIAKDVEGRGKLDIADVALGRIKGLSDAMKSQFIENRKPHQAFIFPTRQFKDGRNKSSNRRAQRDWFDKFPFASYSQSTDGIFCLCCLLFPCKADSGRRSSKFISEPYSNWRKARDELAHHSKTIYHRNSQQSMTSFMLTHANPGRRIDSRISDERQTRIAKNREILKSILGAIEFLGRQGQALRGHRDDGTIDEDAVTKGNFMALLQLLARKDEVLKAHQDTCDKNSTYTSKTSQNEFLNCICDEIQSAIVQEIKDQPCGPYFAVVADEVTDSSNWEQLGIVLRYTRSSRAIERLVCYAQLVEITGDAISDEIISRLNELRLDVSMCRAQTYDGAGNMAGKINGAAANFKRKTLNEKAEYFHCASHELNLTLSKASQVQQVHNTACLLQQLGKFFFYSPKRQRFLEGIIKRNVDKKVYETMRKKVKPLCETRWVERHKAYDDLGSLYPHITMCLQYISERREGNWDPKTHLEATGLLKQLQESQFFVTFQVCCRILGYTHPIAKLLQGTNMEIVTAYQTIEDVKTRLQEERANADSEFEKIFKKAQEMSTEEIKKPRVCGRQTLRGNIESDTAEVYWRRTVYIPFIDCMINQLECRFQGRNHTCIKALLLLPEYNNKLSDEEEDSIFTHFRDELPVPFAFAQEVITWKSYWQNSDDIPRGISGTLTRLMELDHGKMFPNIATILHILLTIPSTSASVERANSALKYIKNKFRSQMSERRLNALIMMYVHRDIHLNYDAVIDRYARQHPRKMIFMNPIGDN